MPRAYFRILYKVFHYTEYTEYIYGMIVCIEVGLIEVE